MTARMPTDPPREWLTIREAAGRLGISPSGFRGLAKREGIAVLRRGSRPGERSTEVDAYLDRARLDRRTW
jgi:hypothetical protein